MYKHRERQEPVVESTWVHLHKKYNKYNLRYLHIAFYATTSLHFRVTYYRSYFPDKDHQYASCKVVAWRIHTYTHKHTHKHTHTQTHTQTHVFLTTIFRTFPKKHVHFTQPLARCVEVRKWAGFGVFFFILHATTSVTFRVYNRVCECSQAEVLKFVLLYPFCTIQGMESIKAPCS